MSRLEREDVAITFDDIWRCENGEGHEIAWSLNDCDTAYCATCKKRVALVRRGQAIDLNKI